MTSPTTVHFPEILLLSQNSNTTITAGQPLPLIGGFETNIFSGQTSTIYNFAPGVSSGLILRNTTGADLTTRSFRISGFDNYNKDVSVSVSGPTANSFREVGVFFNRITNFTCNANISDSSVLLYTSGDGFVDFTVDYYNGMSQYTLQYSNMNVPGSTTVTSYYPQYTITRPMIFENGQYINNPKFYNDLFNIPLENTNIIVSPSDSTTSPLDADAVISMRNVPVVAFRTFIDNSEFDDVGYGGIDVTLLQQGARY